MRKPESPIQTPFPVARRVGLRFRRTLHLLGALFAAGCASVGNVQRADTLGKGNLQIGIEPGVQALAASGAFVAYPHLDASLRYGVTDGVDVGARAGSSFLELQGKFLLTKPGGGGLIASIAPTVGGLFVGAAGVGAGLLYFGLPVLLGIPLGQHELVIGPRLHGQYLFAAAGTSSAGELLLSPGATFGVALQVTETVALLPELGLAVPVFGTTGVGSLTSMGRGVLAQLKVGILIGKRRKATEEDFSQHQPPPLSR